MPRKKKASVSQQFEGSFNVKNFEEAISQIEAEHHVKRLKTASNHLSIKPVEIL